MPNPRSESPEHFQLKRLALIWVRENGYAAAAAEVTLPQFRFRLDVAAYRPATTRTTRHDAKTGKERRISVAAIGTTAIFECKASRPDYLRDSRSMAATVERLKTLAARKARHEETLQIHCPSIRNGDSLFPEYETLNFERPGWEPYRRLLDEMRVLSARLHGRTKFDRLTKWGAANLQYVVAEKGLFRAHELPAGWGLLLRNGGVLELVSRPVFHEVGEAQRLALLHRIAGAGTRAVNAAFGIRAADNDAHRLAGQARPGHCNSTEIAASPSGNPESSPA
jgi:hypothetical protein